ncbi:MAG: hypothetical protein ACOX5X_01045 [Acholeplasmataceae bacterium]|jgi:hypothetical protein
MKNKKYNFVHTDGEKLYFLAENYIDIYLKANFKKIKRIKIKHPSQIAHDKNECFLIVSTTQTNIHVYDLNYKEMMMFELETELFDFIYLESDKKIYGVARSFEDGGSILFMIDITKRKVTKKLFKGVHAYSLVCGKEKNLYLLKNDIEALTNLEVIVIKPDTLEIIEEFEYDINWGPFTNLGNGIGYDSYNGIYNFINDKKLSYSDLKVIYPIMYMHKEEDKYYIYRYKQTYVFDADFNLIKEYHAKNIDDWISSMLLLEDKEIIIK